MNAEQRKILVNLLGHDDLSQPEVRELQILARVAVAERDAVLEALRANLWWYQTEPAGMNHSDFHCEAKVLEQLTRAAIAKVDGK